MMGATQPRYNHNYTKVRAWRKKALADLGIDVSTGDLDAPVGAVVTTSYSAWRRSVNAPNSVIAAHCQRFWVHDMSEFRKTDDGGVVVTCTCGLEVDMPASGDPRTVSYLPKYFAEQRRETLEWQREFFAAPGHRDPFHTTVLGGYLIRVQDPQALSIVRLELQCQHCGWLEETSLDASWDAFVPFGHRLWIDIHNAGCRGKGVTVFDEDIFLYGHGPSAWFRKRVAEQALDAEKPTLDAE